MSKTFTPSFKQTLFCRHLESLLKLLCSRCVYLSGDIFFFEDSKVSKRPELIYASCQLKVSDYIMLIFLSKCAFYLFRSTLFRKKVSLAYFVFIHIISTVIIMYLSIKSRNDNEYKNHGFHREICPS